MPDHLWLQAVSRLTPVPPQHARPTVALDEAALFLRCPASTVAALSSSGLPQYDAGFDQFDLINLALHARPGTSIPEISLGLLLRFVTQDASAWVAPTRWKFTANGRCGSGNGNGAGESTGTSGERWVLWAPSDAHDLRSTPRHGGAITVAGPQISFSCATRTDGVAVRIYSPEIQAVVREILDAGYAFTRMPTAAQRDAEWMREHRVFDCVSISAELERQFVARGLQCRTRYGWLAALAASGHAWIEVLDEDNEWKVIDLALRALAQILYPKHQQFQEFCLGSRLNRLLPTGCPIDEPLIRHDCDSAADGSDYTVTVQQLAC